MQLSFGEGNTNVLDEIEINIAAIIRFASKSE
jgi:hypothetical protein